MPSLFSFLPTVKPGVLRSKMNVEMPLYFCEGVRIQSGQFEVDTIVNVNVVRRTEECSYLRLNDRR